MEFKKGNVVRHISSGQIGEVLGAETSDWDYSNDIFQERHKQFISVRFYDIHKKYSGLFEAESFELVDFNTPKGNDLTNWMATPNEKLRTALENKQTKHLQKRIGQRRMRMDGRR